MVDEAALIAFLRSCGAADAPHAKGRALLDHLVGTRRIVQAWGQPVVLADAAIVHSVYGTDVYTRQSVSPARRDDVRALVGDAAERLAFAFCAVDRRAFRARLRECGSAGPLEVPAANGTGSLTLEPHETFALIVLHMANEVEQLPAEGPARTRVLAIVAELRRYLDPAFGSTAHVWSPDS